MLPLGVIVPTRNSMKYLPGHVESLSTWIDLAEQVVVVDSFSTDGSADFLKKNLRHPQIRILQHPPGLYASWNHGVQNVTTEFCYISTVGDSITRAGIEHLVSTASRLQSDVLVSPPEFVDDFGRPAKSPEWPMDEVIRRLQLRRPSRLSSVIMVATVLAHTGCALTGSCASDVFRVAALRRFPFPSDYGHAADGVWGLKNAGRICWAVTPEKCSIFRQHPPTNSAQERKADAVTDGFPQIAAELVNDWLQSGGTEVPEEIRADLKRLLSVSIEYAHFRRRYNDYRKGKWPWVLQPGAWRLRTGRNRLKSQIDALMQVICRQEIND